MAMFDETTSSMYNNNNTDNGVRMKLADNFLVKLIQYVVYPSDMITKKSWEDLQSVLDGISIDKSFEQDRITGRNLFRFLKELVGLLLKQGNNYEIISQYFIDRQDTQDGYSEKFLMNVFNVLLKSRNKVNDDGKPLFTDMDILAINNDINNRLKYIFLYENANAFQVLAEYLNNASVDMDSIVKFAEPLIENVRDQIKKVGDVNAFSHNDLMLGARTNYDDERAKRVTEKILVNVRTESNKLKSGFKSLNRIIDGGFESGRTYVFVGLPKHFKSGTLLNICLSIMKHNPNWQPKHPGKIPCVLYLTQENTEDETYERIFKYLSGNSLNDSPMTNREVESYVEKELAKTHVALAIKYRPTNSITTTELDSMYEELLMDGYEPMVIVQDYIKRMLPATRSNDDLRLSLGAIVDEMGTIAKDKRIPIITAAQLNREAAKLTEQYERMQNPDVAKNFGSSFIAESVQIVENADYGIIINRENAIKNSDILAKHPNVNRSYLTFKLIASRNNGSNALTEYFAQPFDNEFKLTEDYGTNTVASFKDVQSAISHDYSQADLQELLNNSNTPVNTGNNNYGHNNMIQPNNNTLPVNNTPTQQKPLNNGNKNSLKSSSELRNGGGDDDDIFNDL